MIPCWPLSGARLIAALAVISVGYVTSEIASAAAAAPPKRASCDQDARRLMEAAVVYAAPRSRTRPTAKLASGHFFYRCEQRGEWLGVMFPKEKEYVDCWQRQANRACSRGWIRRNVKMELYG
jgi:hypothetical protein